MLDRQSLETERTKRLSRIRRVSFFMKWFVTGWVALMVIVAVLVLGMFFSPEFDAMTDTSLTELKAMWQELGAGTIDFGDTEREVADIPFVQRGALAIMGLFALVTLMICLWQIRQLFESFRQNDFFSGQALARMLALGWLLVVFGIFDIVCDPLGSALLTLDYPAGQREVSIEIEGAEIFFVIFGAIMILFGWIMREAANIEEENRQFI